MRKRRMRLSLSLEKGDGSGNLALGIVGQVAARITVLLLYLPVRQQMLRTFQPLVDFGIVLVRQLWGIARGLGGLEAIGNGDGVC